MELGHTLQAVFSGDDAARTAATDALAAFENVFGFCDALLQVAEAPGHSPEARQLALVCINNVVRKHWRPRRPDLRPLSDQEKDALRTRVLQGLRTEEPILMRLRAALVTSIARIVFAKDGWPELMAALTQMLQGDDLDCLCGTYTLQTVLKALRTAQLPAAVAALQRVAGDLFSFVGGFLVARLQQLEDSAPLVKYALKTQRLLLVKCLPQIAVEEQARHVQLLVQLVETLSPRGCAPGSELYKCVGHALRTLVDARNAHPLAFAVFLPQLLPFAMQLLHAPSTQERISGALFLCGSLKAEAYEGAPEPQAALASFFLPDVCISLCSYLTTDLIPMGEAELRKWKEDPEDFYLLQQGLSEADTVSAAAQSLLLELLEAGGDVLAQLLLELISNSIDAPTARTASLEELLRADAVLLVSGITLYLTCGAVDFASWLQYKLLPILLDSQEACVRAGLPQVLHRRVLWLLSCWVGFVPAEARFPVFRVCVAFVGEDMQADLCTRTEALATLTMLVQEWELNDEERAMCAPMAVTALASLVSAASEVSPKLEALTLMDSLLRDIGFAAAGLADAALAPLPGLWGDSAVANTLRPPLLSILKTMTSVMASHSPELHAMTLPAVLHATDPASDETLTLLAAGLELWLALLENAPQYSQGVDELFPRVLQLLEYDPSSETMARALQLLQAYALLGGEQLFERHHSEIGSILRGVAEAAAKSRTLSALLADCVDVCLVRVPAQCVACLPLSELIAAVLAGEPGDVGFLSVLARVLVVAPEAFDAALAPVGGQDELRLALMRAWLRKLDEAAYGPRGAQRRRLWGLALSRYLVLQPLPAALVEGLADLLLRDLPPPPAVTDPAHHLGRRMALDLTDVVFSTDLKAMVWAAVAPVAAGMDPAVVEVLQPAR